MIFKFPLNADMPPIKVQLFPKDLILFRHKVNGQVKSANPSLPSCNEKPVKFT